MFKKLAKLTIAIGVGIFIQCFPAVGTPDFLKSGEDLPVKIKDSSYARYSGGVGNVKAGEVLKYSDDSEYQNIIDESIGMDKLAIFSQLTFRAYLPRPLKSYPGEYVFYVFHIAADNGTFRETIIKRINLAGSRDSYMERKEIGLPGKLGGNHDTVDYFGGYKLRLASGSYNIEKPRYFLLETDNEIHYGDFLYLRIDDLRRLQYRHEFERLKITTNVYSMKSDGERLMGKGNKTVYHRRSDGTIEKRTVPRDLFRVEHYKFGEHMATGEFDIVF